MLLLNLPGKIAVKVWLLGGAAAAQCLAQLNVSKMDHRIIGLME